MYRFLICAACLALLACSRDETQAPGTATPPQPATVAADPVDLAGRDVSTTIPTGGPDLVSSVRVGTSLAQNGDVAAEQTSFQAGEPLHVVMTFRDVPAGAVARVVIHRDDAIVAEQQKDLPEGAPRALFTFADTSSWPAGTELTVEAFMGGTPAAERQIRIAAGN